MVFDGFPRDLHGFSLIFKWIFAVSHGFCSLFGLDSESASPFRSSSRRVEPARSTVDCQVESPRPAPWKTSCFCLSQELQGWMPSPQSTESSFRHPFHRGAVAVLLDDGLGQLRVGQRAARGRGAHREVGSLKALPRGERAAAPVLLHQRGPGGDLV